MATAFDVAEYILKECGPMSAMKLQKLVYYAQAWSTVWDDEPLFRECIEAWANGPVVRELYDVHKGTFLLNPGTFTKGNAGNLTADQVETVEAVLRAYAKKSAQWLSDQTHAEAPWKEARAGLDDGDRGNSVISLSAMSDYYSSLR